MEILLYNYTCHYTFGYIFECVAKCRPHLSRSCLFR